MSQSAPILTGVRGLLRMRLRNIRPRMCASIVGLGPVQVYVERRRGVERTTGNNSKDFPDLKK